MPYNKKDELNYQDDVVDCSGIESCDCQGICTCEPGLEIDEEDEGCSNCDCDTDDDEQDCDEFDEDKELQDEFM